MGNRSTGQPIELELTAGQDGSASAIEAAFTAHLPGGVGREILHWSEGARVAATADAWPLAALRRRAGHTGPALPVAVARPRSTPEVAMILRACNAAGMAVTVRGNGSSVTGSPLPVAGELVIDLTGIDSVLLIDTDDLTVTVGAGVLGADLEAALSAQGVTTHFSPQSLHCSSVGGWISTRASGQLSTGYGGIEDLVLGLTVVLPDGEIVTLGQVPRASLGPRLDQLFVGAEGTLGIITEATLRIWPIPAQEWWAAWAFQNLSDGLASMRAIAQTPPYPSLLRLYDPAETTLVGFEAPPGTSVLLAGLDGSAGVVAARAADIESHCTAGRHLGPEPVRQWLARRYDFSAIQRRLCEPGGIAETIEVAARWSQVAELHTALRAALSDVIGGIHCHFSHAYPQGTSLYVILLDRAADDHDAVRRVEAAWSRVIATCASHHAVIAHHHGVGLARQEWLPAALGSGHTLLRRIKDALDPTHLLTPGKLALGAHR